MDERHDSQCDTCAGLSANVHHMLKTAAVPVAFKEIIRPLIVEDVDGSWFPDEARALKKRLTAKAGTTNWKAKITFTMRSLLVCQKPAPKKILGYLSWQVTQTWHRIKPKMEIDYDVNQMPAWTGGSGGLQKDILDKY